MNNNYDKPLIASYTEIAALLCVVQNNSYPAMMWKYELYSNICWEIKSNVLYHCGKFDHYTYAEFEDGDRIILHKLPRHISCDDLKKYIDKGFCALLPINTKMLGITNHPYRHNVFIAGYESDNFYVYDFWAPNFTWKCKSINCNELFQSVDFSNSQTVQSFYVFRENPEYSWTDECLSARRIGSNLLVNLGKVKNRNYDYESNAYGFDVYSLLCDRISSIAAFNLTDCQNFQIILNHLKFNKHCLRILLNDNRQAMDILNRYDNFIKKIMKIRTYAYKHYITQRDISKIRNMIIEHLQYICENEKKANFELLEITGAL